jgi:hypothetical protein
MEIGDDGLLQQMPPDQDEGVQVIKVRSVESMQEDNSVWEERKALEELRIVTKSILEDQMG